MFLRFLNFLVKLYGGILLVAIPLIFFNFYAPSITGMDGIVKQSDVKRLTATTQLSVLTMQNLNPESKWFYLYTALAWVVSLYSYMLLYNVWREYVALRQEYFTYPEFLEAYHNRTLMITRIPDELKSETAIYRFVDSLETPAPIEQLVMGRDFEVLSNLVKKHGQINAKMEKAVAKCMNDDT